VSAELLFRTGPSATATPVDDLQRFATFKFIDDCDIAPPFHLIAISANGSINVSQHGDGSIEEPYFAAPLMIGGSKYFRCRSRRCLVQMPCRPRQPGQGSGYSRLLPATSVTEDSAWSAGHKLSPR